MVSVPQRVRITPQVLALFAELERAPRQRGQAYEDKAHELARMLGFTAEWWTCNSVLDRSDGPVHTSPSYIAFHDWHRCHEARRDLLAALEARRAR